VGDEEKEEKQEEEQSLPPFCKKKPDGTVEIIDNREERSGRDQDKEDIMKELRKLGYM